MRLPNEVFCSAGHVDEDEEASGSGEASTPPVRCVVAASSLRRHRRVLVAAERIMYFFRVLSVITRTYTSFSKVHRYIWRVPFAGGLTTSCTSFNLEHVLFGTPRRGSQSQLPRAAASLSNVSSLFQRSAHFIAGYCNGTELCARVVGVKRLARGGGPSEEHRRRPLRARKEAPLVVRPPANGYIGQRVDARINYCVSSTTTALETSRLGRRRVTQGTARARLSFVQLADAAMR